MPKFNSYVNREEELQAALSRLTVLIVGDWIEVVLLRLFTKATAISPRIQRNNALALMDAEKRLLDTRVAYEMNSRRLRHLYDSAALTDHAHRRCTTQK